MNSEYSNVEEDLDGDDHDEGGHDERREGAEGEDTSTEEGDRGEGQDDERRGGDKLEDS